MAIIFVNYCINTPSKRFKCLQNKFFGHFIYFLLNTILQPTNDWMGNCLGLFFLKRPRSVIKGLDGSQK